MRSQVLARVSAHRRRDHDGGWTLIELLVVISLIMILTSVAMMQYRNSVQSTKEAALRSNLYHMRDAIDQYYADKNKYPESLETLVSERYMRSVPKDPITNTTDWQTIPADSEPGNTTSTAGVYEIKSSSQEAALDGSHYSDW
ncbi:MAG: type II secretion system protein [Acidobacteriota bacterium]